MTRSHRKLAAAPLLVACAGLLACSASQDAAPPDPVDAGSDAYVAPEAGFQCTEQGDLDLDGVFAIFARLSLTFGSHPGGAVTVCPVDQTSEGTFLALMRVSQAAGSKSVDKVEALVCTLELPVISAIVGECDPKAQNMVYAGLTFPPALVDAFPATPIAQTQGTIASLLPGGAIDFDRLTFVIGTRETGDAMPGWQMDKPSCGVNDNAPGRGPVCDETCVTHCDAVVDDDKDGWAGVTVHVCGYTDEDKKQKVVCNPTEPSKAAATIQGRALLDLQVDPMFKAKAQSSCEMTGNFDAAIRYNVVGADLYLQNTQISVTSAIKSLPLYEVNADLSRFRAVRIDGKHGGYDWKPDFSQPLDTCRTVIARQNEIK
ncbi:MAG: hypothetical protein HY898_06680 [Deltaproteobacteria bacterium]|nr:hypothetical protein [Deltaproteobacteria bacterium]